jgi:hypothetical protein
VTDPESFVDRKRDVSAFITFSTVSRPIRELNCLASTGFRDNDIPLLGQLGRVSGLLVANHYIINTIDAEF